MKDQVLVFLSESKSLLIAPISKYNSSGLKVDIISLMLPMKKLKLKEYAQMEPALLVQCSLYACIHRLFGKEDQLL